ncbi:MAG: hypothetical protein Q9183_001766 [Haloplaca sp. 2 TL-2023]
MKPSIDLLKGNASVTVIVGSDDEKTVWKLPKDLLTYVSPVFNATFNQGWKESQTDIVELKYDSPAAFELFVRWLYVWTLSESAQYPDEIPVNPYPTVALQAWVLGDKMHCPRFQDFALAHLWPFEHPDIMDNVRYAYTNTSANSQLRRWAIWELFQSDSKPQDVVVLAEELEDFAVDFLRIQTLDPVSVDVTEFLLVTHAIHYKFAEGLR